MCLIVCIRPLCMWQAVHPEQYGYTRTGPFDNCAAAKTPRTQTDRILVRMQKFASNGHGATEDRTPKRDGELTMPVGIGQNMFAVTCSSRPGLGLQRGKKGALAGNRIRCIRPGLLRLCVVHFPVIHKDPVCRFPTSSFPVQMESRHQQIHQFSVSAGALPCSLAILRSKSLMPALALVRGNISCDILKLSPL